MAVDRSRCRCQLGIGVVVDHDRSGIDFSVGVIVDQRGRIGQLGRCRPGLAPVDPETDRHDETQKTDDHGDDVPPTDATGHSDLMLRLSQKLLLNNRLLRHLVNQGRRSRDDHALRHGDDERPAPSAWSVEGLIGQVTAWAIHDRLLICPMQSDWLPLMERKVAH